MNNDDFFYANGLELGVSPYDFTFKFLRQSPQDNAAGGDNVPSQQNAQFSISMSPTHAKSILAGLLDAVSVYEQTVGKIPLPADQQGKLDETLSKIRKG